MILRTITLQEANGLLPLVREHFVKIHIMLSKLHESSDLPPLITHTSFDKKCEHIQLVSIKSRQGKRISAKKKRQLHELIKNEIQCITRLGAIVRTLAPPHIDFPSMENGNLVYLCWHGEDETILHWHYPDDHMAIRQTIVPTRLGPLMVH